MLPASILIPRRVDFSQSGPFASSPNSAVTRSCRGKGRPCFFLTPAGANYFPKRITPDRFRNISAGFLKRKGNNDGLSRRQGQKHKCRRQTFCLFGQGLLRFFCFVCFFVGSSHHKPVPRNVLFRREVILCRRAAPTQADKKKLGSTLKDPQNWPKSCFK